jgi:hypothetical protein
LWCWRSKRPCENSQIPTLVDITERNTTSIRTEPWELPRHQQDQQSHNTQHRQADDERTNEPDMQPVVQLLITAVFAHPRIPATGQGHEGDKRHGNSSGPAFRGGNQRCSSSSKAPLNASPTRSSITSIDPNAPWRECVRRQAILSRQSGQSANAQFHAITT